MDCRQIRIAHVVFLFRASDVAILVRKLPVEYGIPYSCNSPFLAMRRKCLNFTSDPGDIVVQNSCQIKKISYRPWLGSDTYGARDVSLRRLKRHLGGSKRRLENTRKNGSMVLSRDLERHAVFNSVGDLKIVFFA